MARVPQTVRTKILLARQRFTGDIILQAYRSFNYYFQSLQYVEVKFFLHERK